MASCGICGKAVRKTTVVSLLDGGKIASKRACSECVGRGVLLTTSAPGPTLTKAPLDADERDIRAVLRKLAKNYRGLSRAQLTDEATEAMLTAANVADAWAARPEVRR
jgi:hypothetical protein